MSTDLVPQIHGVNVDIKIDQNDLITVMVARAEAMMNGKLTTALAEAKRLEKEQKELDNQLVRSVALVGPEHHRDAIAKFRDAFEAIGMKHKTKIVATSVLTPDRTSITVNFSASMEASYGSIQAVTHVPLNDEQKGLIARLSGLTEQLLTAREEVILWRKKLAQMPALERQYKAKLVESQLSRTDAGKVLLAALDLDNFEQQVLAIPGA